MAEAVVIQQPAPAAPQIGSGGWNRVRAAEEALMQRIRQVDEDKKRSQNEQDKVVARMNARKRRETNAVGAAEGARKVANYDTALARHILQTDAEAKSRDAAQYSALAHRLSQDQMAHAMLEKRLERVMEAAAVERMVGQPTPQTTTIITAGGNNNNG